MYHQKVKSYAAGGEGYATSHTKQMGTQAEQSFETIIESSPDTFGGYRSATNKEERFGHFDYVVDEFYGVKNARVEVKATKAPSRGQQADSTILYIELRSVGGHPGWVFGQADFIAFQLNDGFVVFKRPELAAYTRQRTTSFIRAKKSGIPNTLYGRPERNDLVAILNTNETTNSLRNFWLCKKEPIIFTCSIHNTDEFPSLSSMKAN